MRKKIKFINKENMEIQKICELWKNLGEEDILKNPLGMFIIRCLNKEKEIEGLSDEIIEELKIIDYVCGAGEIIKVKADVVPLDVTFQNNKEERLFCVLTPIKNNKDSFVREIKFNTKGGSVFKRVRRYKILKTVVKNYFCLLEVIEKSSR